MIGLALSGGGLRGAYQIGVYKALREANIKIDGFVGTSIGAFNAASLASGKYDKLYNFWYNCDAGKILGFTEKLVDDVNNKKVNIKEILINAKNILVNKGISTDGLKQVLEDFELSKYLYDSKSDFGLVTVKFKTFKPTYMFKKDIEPKLLNEYIIASCYLPIFKMEKVIDNNYYLDGGFYDNLPANSLIDKGYHKVYVVDLEAIGVKRKYKDKSKIVEIKPSRNLGSILNIRQVDIRNNIKLGYYDTLKVIKKYDGMKYIFKVKKDWYYNLLIRNVDNRLKREMENYFNSKNSKELIIKALEYVMKMNNFTYYEVYDVRKVIKRVNKLNKDYAVYKFIRKLKIF
ncbi:patatin-like phospholipase family protein [bacterium]|nr:patatin-like phospholipase family protein [bacterium]